VLGTRSAQAQDGTRMLAAVYLAAGNALTGMCKHNDVPEPEGEGENHDKGTKL
jgi:hypothetical protein